MTNEIILAVFNFIIDPEFLKVLGISTPVVTSAILTVKKVSKLIEEQRILSKKQEMDFINAIAEAMGESIKVEVDESLATFRSVKQQQYQISETALIKYAEKIVGTAPLAVSTLCPDLDEKDREVVIALWINTVRDTFITDVYQLHINEVNRNGFLRKSMDDYIHWARTELATKSFDAFLTGMRQKYVNERIRSRIEWIAEHVDKSYISDVCEDIAREWRTELEKYHEKRESKIKDLVNNIRNRIIAVKANKEQ